MNASINFQTQPAQGICGDLKLPGDKSISHRSIMLGSIAQGVTEVTGFLEGEDSLATLKAFERMGVQIERLQPSHLRIQGVGLTGLKQPTGPLDMGNSGTAMRLMTGLLSGQSFESTLFGDASLSKRPMSRVAEPLNQMGADINTQAGLPPVHIAPAPQLIGGEYQLNVSSAQVKSSLLLAGLYAKYPTIVRSPGVTRDHTERMLEAMGVPIEWDSHWVQMSPVLAAGQQLQALSLVIPTDISSAAFFLVAASIVPNSDLWLRSVGLNPTRSGVIEILELMGAHIEIHNRRQWGCEPVADIRVKSAPLTGIHIPEHLVPLAIDEFPVLFIAAACAEGETLLTGASELKVKESNRIDCMVQGLRALGVDAVALEEGARIQKSSLTSGTVKSYGDHRIAMAFAIAGCVALGPIVIEDCENVATSFPGFIDMAQQVGVSVESVGYE